MYWVVGSILGAWDTDKIRHASSTKEVQSSQSHLWKKKLENHMASSHNDGAVRDTVDGCSPQPVGEGRKCSTEGVPELGVQDKETAAGKRERNVRGLACTKTGSTLGN